MSTESLPREDITLAGDQCKRERPCETIRFVEDEYPGATALELLDSLTGICWCLREQAVQLDIDPEVQKLALAAHVLSRQIVARVMSVD